MMVALTRSSEMPFATAEACTGAGATITKLGPTGQLGVGRHQICGEQRRERVLSGDGGECLWADELECGLCHLHPHGGAGLDETPSQVSGLVGGDAAGG